MSDFPVNTVEWAAAYRLVPSRFPPRGLFDRVSRPDDLEATLAVESLTNDRLRDEVGDIALVPADERMVGPGTTPIMAAFTHLNENGSRFSDGTFGVFYAGHSVTTAVQGTVYHRERFLADSNQSATTVQMRAYRVSVTGRFRDLRDAGARAAALLAPDDYSASQPFGARQREQGSTGIVYPSVRDATGECVAVFRTHALSPATQSAHYGYVWDGQQITDVITLGHSGITPHGTQRT